MPIHVILGKPGSGKSLYATSLLVKELRESERNVVTNLPLNVGRLNEYLQQRWPKENLRMCERLRMLSDDELRTFWKYRGPEGNAGTNGVAYFLDEAHIGFNARDWAMVARDAIHYLSQHRKLGDVVFPITQAPGNLDKQFRSVAEDFTVLRNEYTAKFGPFKGRGRFVRKTYISEPTNSPNQEPFEKATFTLDREGIASCYDTARGIGVQGSKADIGRRAKGIPILAVIPLAMLVASLCVVIPWAMGKASRKFLGTTKVEAKAAKVLEEVKVQAKAAPVPEKMESVRVEEPIEVCAITRFGKEISVRFAQGGRQWTVTSADPKLQAVFADDSVLYNKKRYEFRKSVILPVQAEAQIVTAIGRR